MGPGLRNSLIDVIISQSVSLLKAVDTYIEAENKSNSEMRLFRKDAYELCEEMITAKFVQNGETINEKNIDIILASYGIENKQY